MKPAKTSVLTAVLAVLFSPDSLQACATCFGASDEAMAKGMNMGILTLLFCICGVLVGMSGVGFYLVRRAARMAATAAAANEAGAMALPAGQTLK